MLTLTFRQSKSKNYKEAIQHARFLGEPEVVEGFNVLHLPLRNIIEKWEWFNLLFWIVLDWKGTAVTYEGVTYHSHKDKTKIFYAVQQIHTNWINYTTCKLIDSYKVMPSKSKLMDIDPDKLSNEEVDRLIDVMLSKKRIKERYEEGIREIERGIFEGEKNDY